MHSRFPYLPCFDEIKLRTNYFHEYLAIGLVKLNSGRLFNFRPSRRFVKVFRQEFHFVLLLLLCLCSPILYGTPALILWNSIQFMHKHHAFCSCWLGTSRSHKIHHFQCELSICGALRINNSCLSFHTIRLHPFELALSSARIDHGY